MRMRVAGDDQAGLQQLASEDALARRIKAERKKRGWSQEELASRVERILGGGFPQSAISKIERDRGQRRAITVDEALALSKVLEIPLLELLLPPEAAASRDLQHLLVMVVGARQQVLEALQREESVLRHAAEQFRERPELRKEFDRQAAQGEHSEVFALFMEQIRDHIARSGASDG